MSATAFPIADADRCVKCALCLPHCPTYRVSKDEGESPRGRIALMQGMASGALEPSPALAAHLDHCLACRACEAVCPAEVPYGKLIDAARAELRRHGHREPWFARHFASHMRHRLRRRLLQRFMYLAERSGLSRLARRFGPKLLKRMLGYVPVVVPPRDWQERYMPRKELGGEVQIFTGCVADIVQPQVTAATIAMLNALGVVVYIPRSQVCCGALDQHAGRSAQATRLARENLAAFAGEAPVLGSASGCTATLKEYVQLAGPAAAGFAARVQDVSAYVAGHKRTGKIEYKAWPTKTLVHAPCTLRNVLKDDKAGFELLKLIPGLKLKALPAGMGCCGAAGSYMLTEAEQADAFADAYADCIKEQQAGLLVTSNVGCAMHLRAALIRHGVRIPVLHPIEVLARQLPDSLYRPGMDVTVRGR